MKSHYYKIIICLFIFSFSFAFPQQPTQEWVARYQGPNNDLYRPFISIDKQGNSYITGTHVVNDSINIICSKYNSGGIQLWSKLYKYPGEGYFAPTGIATDSFGNAYVITLFGQTYLSPYNSLLIKFDCSNGNPVWAKRYIGKYIESSFYDIKIDKHDNIYVSGNSDTSHLLIRYNTNGDSVWVRSYHPQGLRREVAIESTIDDSLNVIFTGFRRFYYPPYGYYDSLLVVKYSSGGSLRWESVYAINPLAENRGRKIISDQNGNIYIGSGTWISSGGDWLFLSMKYDGNGIQQWVNYYDAPGIGDNILNAIALDKYNNAFYLTGNVIANGKGAAATIKYNATNGDSIWVKIDTVNHNRALSKDMAIDSVGNIYITGETYNFPSYEPYDIFTVKYSITGNSIWAMTYNGNFNGLDISKAIKLDESNNIYILGVSQSSSQVSDYVIIKYSQVSGVNPISNIIPYTFKLEQNYPNPFNPNTNIKYQIKNSGNVKLTVFDISGKVVATLVNEKQSSGNYEVTFDAKNFASGIFFYELSTDEYTETRKMVLIK